MTIKESEELRDLANNIVMDIQECFDDLLSMVPDQDKGYATFKLQLIQSNARQLGHIDRMMIELERIKKFNWR